MSTAQPQQLDPALLDDPGYLAVADVLPPDLVARALDGAYRVRERIIDEIGADRVSARIEHGDNAIRLGFVYDPVFFELFDVAPLLSLIDSALGRSSILRFQNIEILPPHSVDSRPVAQNLWHQNFSHHALGDRLTLEAAFILSDAGDDSCQFEVVPASHSWVERPDADELERQAEPLFLPAGSLLAFDGRLWHRERRNRSRRDVVLVTMQFVRPFMKPHFDYVRALGAGGLDQLPERTRYLLGSRTRIPESLEQFYLPPEQQLYRPLSK